MKKIKILQFVGGMNCGGTETMLMNLFRKMDKEKYDFTFAVNIEGEGWYDKEILELGGKIIKVNRLENLGVSKYIDHLVTVIKEGNYDAIHSHTFLHSGLIMKAAKKAGVKIRISHSHSAMDNFEKSFKYKLKKFFLQRLILSNSTHIVACSTEAGYCLFGKEFNKRGVLLPNPIKLNEVMKCKKEASEIIKTMKKQYCIADNCFIVGHVGRLVDIKNHRFMIQIAKRLKEKQFKFKMFFLGDGELKETIEKQIKDNGLIDEIILTGNVSNVYEYMQLFDLLLLPSFYEGLPVTLVEAQASGLFSFVSSNVSKESDLGLNLIDFLELDNIDEWIDKIIKYEKVNISDKKIISKISEKKYSDEISIKEYEKLYN